MELAKAKRMVALDREISEGRKAQDWIRTTDVFTEKVLHQIGGNLRHSICNATGLNEGGLAAALKKHLLDLSEQRLLVLENEMHDLEFGPKVGEPR